MIREEQNQDIDAIHALHRQAFGGSVEAQLVDELRAEGYVRLSLVMEENGAVVGHILFSPLPIDTEKGSVEALAVAPLAVLPEYQRQGIGSALMREGLRQAAEMGGRAVFVLGEPDYYTRFGFSARLAESIVCPYSGPYLMALELQPGALDGVTGEAHYAPPFGRL